MPYISKERQDDLNAFLSDGAKATEDFPDTIGEVNYVITRIISAYLMGSRDAQGDYRSYTKFNEIIGVLECAKLEAYRRLLAPYEDQKMAENGDAYPDELGSQSFVEETMTRLLGRIIALEELVKKRTSGYPPRSSQPPRSVQAIVDEIDRGGSMTSALKAGEDAAAFDVVSPQPHQIIEDSGPVRLVGSDRVSPTPVFEDATHNAQRPAGEHTLSEDEVLARLNAPTVQPAPQGILEDHGDENRMPLDPALAAIGAKGDHH